MSGRGEVQEKLPKAAIARMRSAGVGGASFAPSSVQRCTQFLLEGNGQAACARFPGARRIDVDRLFTHRWTLGQTEEAYQLFDKQVGGKGVLM